jgi:hypothetical protein
MSAALLLALAAQAAPPADPPAQLGDIRAHLFYEATGRLSSDVSPPREFSAWNTIIGGGEAEEPASDLLIVVELRAEGEHFETRPLRIVARDGRGRILGERRFDSLYTSEAGRLYRALWLRDATCAGEIDITATLGRETRTERLTFHCGE